MNTKVTASAARSLYFTEPQQLLAVFAELETQNLALITNGQETAEALHDLDEQTRREMATMAREKVCSAE